MKFSALVTQVLPAPPYIVAFIAVLITAFLSDRFRNRSNYIVFHALLGGYGYMFIAIAGWIRAGSGWRHAGVYPRCIGVLLCHHPHPHLDDQ